MHRTFAIARKEFLHIIRDPRSLMVAIVMPVAMVLLYGYAINMELKRLAVGIMDSDNSPASRELVREMVSSGFIVDARRLSSRVEIEPGFRRGRFRAVVIIPTNYGKSLVRERYTPVQIIVDGADGSTAAIVDNYLQAVIARLNRLLVQQLTGRAEMPIETRLRFFYNPQLVSANFIVPGLTAVILMMICALLTSIAMAREKETGTMEQILTTPVRSPEVVIGKLMPYLTLGVLDATFVLLVGVLVFRVPMNGSWLALAGYTLLFIVIALSLGLLISTFAPTQQVAMMAAMMGTLLPTLLLSGFIFAIDSMPLVLRVLSHLIPATYFLRVIRGVMLKGVNWFPLEGGILMLMLMLILTVAVARFRRRLE